MDSNLDYYHNEERGKYPVLYYLTILVVCWFSFFINNQVIPADLMESRNLATAQEMVREGNYLIPTMNGELRLEKPPLPTWIAACIEQVLPDDLVVQRYAAGIAGTLMVIFLFLLVSELSKNAMFGLFAALILATCYNTVLMGRTATWDIYCHSFMLGAIYYLMLSLRRKGSQWMFFLTSGFFLGLSFLSKGPVSFFALLLPFIISYGIVYKTAWKGKIAPLCTMVLICLIISSWWTLYLLLSHPEMMLSVAQKESTSWLDHNVRSWYYYWKFPAEAGIWALFLVTSIGYFFVRHQQAYRDVYRFAFFWFLSSLLLLSAIPEKKTRYLLPILIPAAILIGIYFLHLIKDYREKSDRILFRINALIIALILFAIPVALYMMFYRQGELSAFMFALSILFGVGLGGSICVFCFKENILQIKGTFIAIILGMMTVTALYLPPIGDIFINTERESIKMLRYNTQLNEFPFFYNKDEFLRMELVYEMNKTIRPIDVGNDSLMNTKTPFILMSTQPIDSLLLGRDFSVVPVGTFDNNWRQVGSKRYNWDLVKHVAIINSNPPSGNATKE